MSQLLSQYGPNIGIALAGLKADSKPADILSLINGNRANQVQTVTVADTWATGDTLKIDIVLPDEVSLETLSYSYTFTVAATETPTAAAQGVKALIQAESALEPFLTVSGDAAVLTFTSEVAGMDISIASTSTTAGNGDSTDAETVAPLSGAALDFGVGVDFLDDDSCIVHQSGGKFAGIALRDITRPKDRVTTNGYEIRDIVSVLAEGTVWVLVNDTVVAGDPVYCVHTGAGYIGQFRNDNTNADLVSGAKFVSSAVSGGLAKVKIG